MVNTEKLLLGLLAPVTNNMNIRRAFTLCFAIAITSLSVRISTASARELGDATDQVLLVPLFVFATLLLHFLPSLIKSKIVLIACGISLVATLFGHLNYFVHSAERNDVLREIKAEDSPKVRGLSERIADVSREYSSIGSRTETDISRLLATESRWKVRSALRSESAEAKRKISLSNQLAALKQELAKLREASGSDTVTREISRIASVSPITVRVSFGLLLALLVDLSGAILWYEIAHGKVETSINIRKPETEVIENEKVNVPTLVDAPIMSSTKVELREDTKLATIHVSNDMDVSAIILAINEGKCRQTVSSIQKHLRCRTSRAAELNRIVKEVLKHSKQCIEKSDDTQRLHRNANS
jgi:hypothetical protein